MLARARAAGIERRAVRLRPLPPPDWLEFDPPTEHVCVVTDDGALSPRLAEALAAHSWRVALLRLPDSDEAIGHALADLAAAHGPIGMFIYIHHRDTESIEKTSETLCAPCLSGEDRAGVKAAFFAAKHLHAPLTSAPGRSVFFTVTQIDGALGMLQNPNPWPGGLTGLVKTLAQEWPTVFCRALDLAPTLAPEQAAAAILAEFHDPDRRITEVGYGEMGRVTLTT